MPGESRRVRRGNWWSVEMGVVAVGGGKVALGEGIGI